MNGVASGASGVVLALLGLACGGTPARTAGCPDPSFEGRREIVEAGSLEESADPCWWLSSGGRFSIDRGTGRTIQGALEPESEWRGRYAESNPADTDGGEHPQNLLRLVTRASWGDYRQEVKFRIARVNLSRSAERGEWSGVLFLMRYLDSDSLYYAGLRMDGTAIIKKKLDGAYTTLAQQPVYGQPGSYDRKARPSLLPSGQWIGLASVIRTDADGAVRIALFTRDERRPGGWQLATEAVDDGRHGTPIRTPGHGGLRADFMDVEFASYAVIRD